MTYEEALAAFGLPAEPRFRDDLRRLLVEEIERAGRDEDGEEMLRALCVQLFSLGFVEDAPLLWRAKRANFDMWCGLDIQLLCGAGLAQTRALLAGVGDEAAADALQYLDTCVEAGDFDGWTPARTIDQYRDYFGL